MAYAEYYVICDQESMSLQKNAIPKWNGAAAESEVLVAPKRAVLVTVNAESRAEAIKGVKQLFPGWVKTKVIGAAKEETEEA